MVVRELFAKLGFQFDEQGVRRFDSAINRVKTRLNRFTLGFQSAFARIGAVLSVGALAAFTRRLIEQGDQLQKQSEALGMSATELRAWQFAAQQSGVDAAQFTVSLNALIARLRGAAGGSKEVIRAFKRLGVSTKDIQQRDIGEILLEAAEGFRKLESPTEKAALALQLFGRNGTVFIPFLNEGREGIEKLQKVVFDLTGKQGLDGFAAAADKADDAMGEFKLVLSVTAQTLAARFLPFVTKAITALTKLAVAYGPVLQQTSVLKAALITLGAVLIKILLPSILGTAVIAAAFAAAFLIVEDFISFLEGKKSVIGEFLDLKDVKEDWARFKETISGIKDTWLEFLQAIKVWEPPPWFLALINASPFGVATSLSRRTIDLAGRAANAVQAEIHRNITINAGNADAKQVFNMVKAYDEQKAREAQAAFAQFLAKPAVPGQLP